MLVHSGEETTQLPMIALEGVTKVYGAGQAAVRALGGIDLDVAEGEFVAIMGPSGSGKSTAMNILGCLDVPTAGAYRFRGVDVGTLTRNPFLFSTMVGIVFGYFPARRAAHLNPIDALRHE